MAGVDSVKGGAKLDEHIADTAADIVQKSSATRSPARSGAEIASACSLGLILG